MSSNIVRSVGRLEKCSTARHSLGLYRSVIVTGRYSHDHGLDRAQLQKAIFGALSRVIPRHPALCCGIIGEDGPNPSFVALERVDLLSVVRISTYPPDIGLSNDELLCRLLEEGHNKLWTNLDKEPAWRIIVSHLPQPTRDAQEQSRGVMDIIFIFHHALSDGLSGAAFHKSLLGELRAGYEKNDSSELDRDTEIVDIPGPINLIEPVEKLIRFTLSWLYMARQVLDAFFPTWISGKRNTQWAGSNYQLSDVDAYRSRIRLLAIPPAQVQVLVAISRRRGVALTGLITGFAVAILASMLPSTESLVGITAYTLRRLTSTPMIEMVNQSSGFETTYPASLLSPLRDGEMSPGREAENALSIARYFHEGLKTEMAKAPRDNLVGLLPLVSDMHGFYRGKLGQKRDHSFELSNLGVVNMGMAGKRGGDESLSWNIDSIIFTQGAQVCGSALTFNCASVEGGPLNVTLTWQEGVVEDSFIDELARRLEQSLRELK